ncbi:MAG: mechanosensitive ion channel [Duncaniella sp.]|nr:mechanosensitive ion channel [Duncaniella sp.]
MQASGCRRIARELIIDSDTIVTATPDMIDSICNKFPIIKSYVSKIKANGGKPHYDPGLAVVNGSVETNLGLFRAYMCQWLLNNPAISSEQQILVRVMVPTGEGIPLQVYCFTNTTKWTAYEAIQSAVIEHVIAVAPQFGLSLFNEPSGTDVTQVKLTEEHDEPQGINRSSNLTEPGQPASGQIQ